MRGKQRGAFRSITKLRVPTWNTIARLAMIDEYPNSFMRKQKSYSSQYPGEKHHRIGHAA